MQAHHHKTSYLSLADKQELGDMAGEKPNLSNESAEDTVFSNLGLTREDLGVGDDDGSGNEDFEQGGGSGNETDRGGSGNEDLDRMSQTTSRQPERTGLPPTAEVHPDHKGNLVNEYGQIVARSGKEARLYQDLHKTKGQAQTLQGQLQDVSGRLRKAVEIGQGLHRELESARAQQNAVKQFGLEQGEVLTAFRLFKELRDNPKEALKNILTRAATNGINIQELGLQGGVDPQSLVNMIKQEIGTAVNPLRERTEAERRAGEQRRQEQERLGQIQGEVDGFFGQNPEAKQYLPVFTQTLQKFPGMTLGEIWARIQLHFASNPQQRRNQNSPRRSLPQGRGAPANGGGGMDLAPVTDSYDAIVKDALSKAGFVR
jgi:hypothetical protein